MRLVHEDKIKTVRIESMSPVNKTIKFVEHFEGGDLAQRNKGKQVSFNKSFFKLKECKARKIYVDPLGRVKDPGAIL